MDSWSSCELENFHNGVVEDSSYGGGKRARGEGEARADGHAKRLRLQSSAERSTLGDARSAKRSRAAAADDGAAAKRPRGDGDDAYDGDGLFAATRPPVGGPAAPALAPRDDGDSDYEAVNAFLRHLHLERATRRLLSEPFVRPR